tara:strand:- start:1851 stop:2150 length:300 start_codon:yes stop_codon:yes gene_type:complete
MMIVLEKLKKGQKKFRVTLENGRKVQFGAKGYSDYTLHKDPNRMRLYLIRHKKREDWSKKGIDTAGFWSRWLLWSKPSLNGAIKLIETKFNVKINERKR